MTTTADGSAGADTFAPRRYRLVSGDGHINEPRDLWATRLPKAQRDRAPHVESFPEGDGWVIDGVPSPITLGLMSSAGLSAEDVSQWIRWEQVPEAGYDPVARLHAQDQDGVDAEVLFPSPRLHLASMTYPDRDFGLECVRVYNDFILEFCAHAPDRLTAPVMIPSYDVEHALAEFERCAGNPGFAGALLGSWPNGTLGITPEDDRFFAAVAESGYPVTIHVGLNDKRPGALTSRLPGDVRFYDAPVRMLQLFWAGVFQRFPTLSFVFAEVDCGWFPYFREQVDDRYHRLAVGQRADLSAPPSEYFSRQCLFTYITDTFAVHNRRHIGVQNILWSNDYPHVGADWPNSWRTIAAAFNGVPEHERQLMLAENAVRVFRIGK